jgi:hypothetical protein
VCSVHLVACGSIFDLAVSPDARELLGYEIAPRPSARSNSVTQSTRQEHYYSFLSPTALLGMRHIHVNSVAQSFWM